MGRADVVTKHIRKSDPLLYCEKSREGKLCIFRKNQTVETYDVDGSVVHFVRPAPYLVIALTDTWNINGEPVDRGLEQISRRLKAIDLWNRDLAKESIESIEHSKASNDRAVDNHIESFLKDNRREFARLTNDINTSTLDRKIKIKEF